MNVLKKIKNVPGLYQHKNTGVYYERIQTPTANTYESLTTTNQDAAKGHLIVRKDLRVAQVKDGCEGLEVKVQASRG